jgi:hypothetical protein
MGARDRAGKRFVKEETYDFYVCLQERVWRSFQVFGELRLEETEEGEERDDGTGESRNGSSFDFEFRRRGLCGYE